MAQMQQAQQGGPQGQPHQTETLEQVQLMHSEWQQQHQIETLEQVQPRLTRQQARMTKQQDWWQRQLAIAKRQMQKNPNQNEYQLQLHLVNLPLLLLCRAATI